MIWFHFFSQISYILVYFMFVLTYGYLDICVYTLKTQSLIFYEYFFDYTNGILLKVLFDFLLFSFNFMLLSLIQCMSIGTQTFTVWTTFYFPTLLALLLPSSPCNYKHNVLFPWEPLRKIPRDFQVAVQKNYTCLNSY